MEAMMETVMKLNFTKAEWEIIQHRLDVPDAIHESLFDNDLPPYYTPTELEDAVAAIESRDQSKLDAANQDAVRDVLANCVEASLVGVAARGEHECGTMSRTEFMSVCNNGNRLARKVSELIGRDVRFSAF